MFPRWRTNNMDSPFNMQKSQFHQTPCAHPFANLMSPKSVNQNIFTNVLMNVTHHPFQRTFASVVSCGNSTLSGQPQKITPLDINSFWTSVIYQQSPQTTTLGQKEFQDYQKMPSFAPSPTSNSSSSSAPTTTTSQPTQQPPQPQQQQQFHNTSRFSWRNHHNNNNNNSNNSNNNTESQNANTNQFNNNDNNKNCKFRMFGNKFHGFRLRNPNKQNHHQQHQHHQQQQHSHPQFHHSDVNNVKHRHEKERINIERDIRNDYCDISKSANTMRGKPRFYQKFNQFRPRYETRKSNNNTSNNNNNTAESPPFEIYSMEEFPAIVKPISSNQQPIACKSNITTSNVESMNNHKNFESDTDDNDFVKFQNDAAQTTPSSSYVQPFTRRFNLCEKMTQIAKSPQKLFALPLSMPKRSCLKATPSKRDRSVSECSDDFIVFDYTTYFTKDNSGAGSSCNNINNCEDEDEVDCDGNDDDDDDIDEDVEEEEEEDGLSEEDEVIEDEEDDECDNDKEDDNRWRKFDANNDNQQPDSGIEERKVSF